MTIETVTYAAHTAYLDHMMGVGVLVLPNHDDDMPTPVVTRHPLPGGLTGVALDTLHEADWNAAMGDLYARGWGLAEDDDGEDIIDGYLPDGRPCLSLYGRDPVVSEPSLGEIAKAWQELRQTIGFEPISAP